MPEGVEVKLSADLIRPLVKGKQIISVQTFPMTSRYAVEDPEGFKEFTDSLDKLEPIYILDVKTRGKFMYWDLSDYHYIGCTFGMTGQWSPTKGKHPCFAVTYRDPNTDEPDQIIYFNDPRHFGTIKFYDRFAILNLKISELGWDPLNDGIHEQWLNHLYQNKISKTSKPIGQVLMDQGLFAGVGNYIRAEALYLTKMSPWRPSNIIKKEEFLSLCHALVDVMNESYMHQGATILTYKDAYGAEGKYSSCFKVYGKKLDPLGNKIVKEDTPDKRTIHWCPNIQK